MNSKSFFTSKTGLGLLSFMLFISVYKGYYFAVTIFAVLILLFVSAPFFARISSGKITAGLRKELCMFPGNTRDVEIEIENNKLLPVVAMSAETGSFSVSASWMGPYEKRICTKPFTAENRGVIKTDRIKLSVSDAFGLSYCEREYAVKSADSIIVYPKVISVNTDKLLLRMSELEKSKNGFYTDKTLINSVMPYSDGMSYKDINQRMLARNDQLFVNVYEKLAMRRVCIIADFESFVERKSHVGPNGIVDDSVLDKDSFEKMLSVIGSLAIELSKKDVVLTLVLPIADEKNARIIVPSSVSEQVPLILRELAFTEYKTEECFVSSGVLFDEIHRLGKLIVLTKDGPTTLFKDDPKADELGFEILSIRDLEA